MLVNVWKDHNKELGSSKQHSIWILIKNKIDATGKPKTVKQIKTKIRNLKGAYKACKDNNKKTSRSSTFAHIFKTLTRSTVSTESEVLKAKPLEYSANRSASKRVERPQ